MKRKVYFLILSTLLSGLFLSCKQTKIVNKTSLKSTQAKTVSKVSNIHKTATVYSIKGGNIFLRVGPGATFDKLINQKATKALGETEYTQVNNSLKVIIEAKKGTWSKIRVVEPAWLSDTYVGWVPTKDIVIGRKENTIVKKLNPNSYEILKIEHYAAVENFHVLVKYANFDKDKINSFIRRFRAEHKSIKCNIMVYDTKSIKPLIDKYPLQGKNYIKLADHFIAMSTFNDPNDQSWYPYQDSQYKEYGGNHWKNGEIN